MKKIAGMTGTHERDGTVMLTYNSQQGYSYSGETKLLPCNTCGDVYEIKADVVGFNCDECVQHGDTCDEVECYHKIHKSSNGSPPYDAATQTGMYDHG